jgi:hypothetical protein
MLPEARYRTNNQRSSYGLSVIGTENDNQLLRKILVACLVKSKGKTDLLCMSLTCEHILGRWNHRLDFTKQATENTETLQ